MVATLTLRSAASRNVPVCASTSARRSPGRPAERRQRGAERTRARNRARCSRAGARDPAPRVRYQAKLPYSSGSLPISARDRRRRRAPNELRASSTASAAAVGLEVDAEDQAGSRRGPSARVTAPLRVSENRIPCGRASARTGTRSSRCCRRRSGLLGADRAARSRISRRIGFSSAGVRAGIAGDADTRREAERNPIRIARPGAPAPTMSLRRRRPAGDRGLGAVRAASACRVCGKRDHRATSARDHGERRAMRGMTQSHSET